MITRERLLKGAGVGVLGSLGAGVAGAAAKPESGPPVALTETFVRSASPPLRIGYPSGWSVYETWGDEAYVNPIPLLALTTLTNGVPTLAERLLATPRQLSASDVLLTFYGVPLQQDERYAPASSSANGVSGRAHVLNPTGVNGVLGLYDWLIRPDGEWGYLIYGYVGNQVTAGPQTVAAVLRTATFD